MKGKKKNIIIPASCAGNSVRGFTLTEIMISVVIVGLIAAFAIPNYEKLIRKAHERTAILQLIALHGANEIYKARNGRHLPGTNLDLDQINTRLSTSIIFDGMEYSYTYLEDDEIYTATAAWKSGNNYTIRVNQNSISTINPCCFVAICPSLPNC